MAKGKLAKIAMTGGSTEGLTDKQKARVDFLQANPNAGGGGKKKAVSGPFSGLKNKKMQNQLNTEAQVQDYQAQQQINYQNPNYNTAFGSQNVTYDENGNPVFNQTLSDANQQLVEGGQNLSRQGQGIASNALNSFTPFQPQDLSAERDRIEGSIYGRLTRDVDSDYAREKEQLEQTLHNRGIPLDPQDPAYQRWMGDLDRKYRDIKENARSQAVEMGGNELTRSFGIERGAQQQQFADIAGVSQLGYGYMAPQLPGYQAPTYQLSNPSALQAQNQQLALERFTAQQNAAAQRGQLAVSQQNANTAALAASKAGAATNDPFPI